MVQRPQDPYGNDPPQGPRSDPVVPAPQGALPGPPGGRERRADVRPEALRGVRIPARTRQGRRWVYRLFTACPWLALPDVPAAARLGDLYAAISRVSARLDRDGLTTASGDPRKLLAEWRALLAEARAHEAALGITAAARASLGVNVGKMADLAALLAGRNET